MDVFRTDDSGAASQRPTTPLPCTSGNCRRSEPRAPWRLRRRRRWLTAAVLGVAAGACGCQLTKPLTSSKQDSAQEALAKALEEGADAKSSRDDASLSVAKRLELGERELERNAQNPQGLDAARSHFESVLAAEPNHPTAHHRLAVIADLRKEFSKAEGHYSKALQGNGADPYLLHDIGYSYALQGRHAEAIPYYQRSLEHAPGWEQPARKLADAYVRTGQSQLAGQTLAQVLPEAQAQEELARLERASDPAARPSLIGRMRSNLRPDQPEPEPDPTQQLMAELQQAKIQGERARLERERQRAAQSLQSPGTTVHNSRLADALAHIDHQGEQPHQAGQPIYLDAQGGQRQMPTAPQFAAAGQYAASYGQSRSAWQNQGHPPQQPPVQYGNASPAAGAMYGNAALAAQQQQQYATQQQHPNQPVEIIRGTERGYVESWPSRAAREQMLAAQRGATPPQQMQSVPPNAQGYQSPVQAVAGTRSTPGSFSQQGGHAPEEVQRADYSAQGMRGGYDVHPESVAWDTTSPAMLNAANAQPLAPAAGPQGQASPAAAEDEYRAAAAMGMGVGPSQMFPVLRQTTQQAPGANSMWNGAQYPQPGRYLPLDRQAVDLSRAHEMPEAPGGRGNLMAPPPNSHGQQMPAAGQYYSQPDQYASGEQWGTQTQYQAPAPQPGMGNPLSAYDQQRAAHDAQRNSLVDQVRSAYPANAVATPSTGIPMNHTPPSARMMDSWNGETNQAQYNRQQPAAQTPATQSQVVTPPRYPSAPQQQNQQTIQQMGGAYPAQQQAARPTFQGDVVVPPPYRSATHASHQTTSYSPPSQVSPMSANGYGGPMIVPGQ